MSDREQARELLHVAERDLRALKGMVDVEVFADEVFGFLAQQAVEKLLKAWLCYLGQTYPFTHDLSLLLSRLEDANQEVEDYWDLVEFNPFAVELRYSTSGLGEPSLDRDDMIGQVAAVIERVRQFIEADDSASQPAQEPKLRNESPNSVSEI